MSPRSLANLFISVSEAFIPVHRGRHMLKEQVGKNCALTLQEQLQDKSFSLAPLTRLLPPTSNPGSDSVEILGAPAMNEMLWFLFV